MLSGVIPCIWRSLLLLWLVPLAAEQWQVRYFYDENNSALTITDFCFPFAPRGIAVGVIDNGKKPRPVSVISTDAGVHWQVRTLSEPPLSLFFLNEDLGWMVTSPHAWENRIWRTTDGGLTWHGLTAIQPQVSVEPKAGLVRESAVKPVGKPDASIGHVRFDERGWETGRRFGVSARAHPRFYKLLGAAMAA
jgi:hypothetical protein